MAWRVTRVTIPWRRASPSTAGLPARRRAPRHRDQDAIEDYKFNEAAAALYQFVWNVFCDWYVELIKPILTGDDETAKAETRASTAWVMDQILASAASLHALHHRRTVAADGQARAMLIEADWPDYKGLGDAAADAEMNWVIRLISEVRSVRAEMNVQRGCQDRLHARRRGTGNPPPRASWETEIMRLARLSSISFEDEVPEEPPRRSCWRKRPSRCRSKASSTSRAEKARLNKELEKIAKDQAAIDGRLNNPGFVAKAPPEVLEESRERKSELEARKAKVTEALGRLG